MSILSGELNQLWSRLPRIYRGASIVAIPIISLLPAIASWSWSHQAKSDAGWSIDRAEEAIGEANSLINFVSDAETGVRGYAIARESNFLKFYQTAKLKIPVSLNTLSELIIDDTQQQAQLGQAKVQIERRLNLLTEVLERLEDRAFQQSPEIAQLFAEGKIEMDRIRQSLDAFEEKEWRRLRLHQQNLSRINKTSDLALGISIASILFGYGLAMKLYLQSQKELEQHAQKLARTNQDLVAVNQLLKNRNQELDQFAYIVSHDLKAPLRGISNLSEWIEEDLEDKLDPDTRKNMNLLRNRVQRMNDFIDGLLQYSRTGQDREETMVDVGLLVREIIDEIAPPPNFTIEIEDKMPVLETEALPLQQVFSNLISNSIKHHPRKDGKIAIFAIKQTTHYQFAIADDGAGIPVKDRGKIFEIFQSLNTEDRRENTGIGLSIVKKIIENRGDKIWLESTLGKGTTFYFTWSIK